QPKVSVSTLMQEGSASGDFPFPRPGAGRRIELSGKFVLGRAGQDDVVVGAPFDHQVAAGEGHGRLAGAALGAGTVDQRGASGGAAGLGEAGAALPGANDQMVGRDDLRQRNVAPLGKDWM